MLELVNTGEFGILLINKKGSIQQTDKIVVAGRNVEASVVIGWPSVRNRWVFRQESYFRFVILNCINFGIICFYSLFL